MTAECVRATRRTPHASGRRIRPKEDRCYDYRLSPPGNHGRQKQGRPLPALQQNKRTGRNSAAFVRLFEADRGDRHDGPLQTTEHIIRPHSLSFSRHLRLRLTKCAPPNDDARAPKVARVSSRSNPRDGSRPTVARPADKTPTSSGDTQDRWNCSQDIATVRVDDIIHRKVLDILVWYGIVPNNAPPPPKPKGKRRPKLTIVSGGSSSGSSTK